MPHIQTPQSAAIARINCVLCMNFRKAPDKPTAATHIKYPISADFFLFFLNSCSADFVLEGKGSDTGDLIAFKRSLTKQYVFI